MRVVRACRDAGIASVAVYADPDRDAQFVRLADEAYSLGGATPAESYLDIAKIIAVAHEAKADSVHPGYGFLAENRDFAQAVIDAGLTWIGPPPDSHRGARRQGEGEAHRAEGERPARAGHEGPRPGRRRGRRVREGQRPAGRDQGGVRWRRSRPEGRPHPRGDPRAVRVGGPRGRRCVRPRRVPGREVPGPSAPRRDPVPGRPARQRRRRLHARLLTQRRHQKLVEEAPAPFLTDEQVATLYSSSKAILREAGYVGAGTCEFLVGQDGTISFLEVNTRLQVEHPVSEEVTGIDLVREMFRIAAGEELGYDDPEVRGHSIEFRINAEDGGRNFMRHPAPSPVGAASGSGRAVDGGYVAGEMIPGSFDSLIAKLIVTGRDATQALERSAGRWRSSSSTACRRHPVPRGGRRRPGVHRRRRRGSTSTRSESRPTSTTRSRRTPATPPRPTRLPSGRRSPSRSADDGSRSSSPAVWAGFGRTRHRWRQEAQAQDRRQGRRGRERRRGHQPDAGHHRRSRSARATRSRLAPSSS